MRFARPHCRPHPLAVALLALCTISGPAAADDDVEASRAAFREVYPAAERGEWQPAQERRALLEDYVLWPDLRAAWLAAKIDTVDDAEVRAFLDAWGSSRPGRELRYRYALQLAKDQRWPEYLEVYRRHYTNAGAARLDCYASRAGIETGAFDEVAGLARSLWLVGESQVDECDPVFHYLRGAGLLEGPLTRQRFELALEAHEFSLARYLAKSLDAESLARVERWIAAGDDPEAFIVADENCRDTEEHRAQLLYALERVAWGDAARAQTLFLATSGKHEFPSRASARIARYIALSAAQQHEPHAFELLRGLPAGATDERVRAWQVRAALLRHGWSAALAAIDDMPPAQRSEAEWRYWHAVALQQAGRVDLATPIFEALAADRSWYGFLAADEIDADYAFAHAATPADEAILSGLAREPALVRARELFYVGLESRGRAEWSGAVARLEPAAKVQAALLAHRWNWHSQAIATLADSGRFDDLEIRYPLAFEQAFLEFAAAAGIRGSLAWAIGRSESLFMADVRSHAGAVGVMQLMPTTGARTAAELGLPWAGVATLTDPRSNIRLGTKYIAKMLERFDGNVVLATAAYNAGPNKVDEWLPRSEHALDARIWIENIPYDETRAFVRRVLFADTIFHWRLTGEPARISAEIEAVAPLPQQVSEAR
ncbi:MAG TPA: transglycosylase SLT domain-containing protein [Woeseiaceae bacterium]